ncbi:hypothetical protein Tco_0985133 [Tanacetum coccineum]
MRVAAELGDRGGDIGGDDGDVEGKGYRRGGSDGEGVAEARADGDRIDRGWIYLLINFGFTGVWPENFSGEGGLVAGGGGSSPEKDEGERVFILVCV